MNRPDKLIHRWPFTVTLVCNAAGGLGDAVTGKCRPPVNRTGWVVGLVTDFDVVNFAMVSPEQSGNLIAVPGRTRVGVHFAFFGGMEYIFTGNVGGGPLPNGLTSINLTLEIEEE